MKGKEKFSGRRVEITFSLGKTASVAALSDVYGT
jgi:hypothetical protein